MISRGSGVSDRGRSLSVGLADCVFGLPDKLTDRLSFGDDFALFLSLTGRVGDGAGTALVTPVGFLDGKTGTPVLVSAAFLLRVGLFFSTSFGLVGRALVFSMSSSVGCFLTGGGLASPGSLDLSNKTSGIGGESFRLWV